MAEANLKDLTSAVYKIAENSPKIQKDVKDIRDAVVGPGGILDAINVIARKLEDKEKGNKLESLTKKSSGKYERVLIKNTNSISNILNKILNKVSNGGGGRKLNTDNLKRYDNSISVKPNKLDNVSNFIDIVERLRGIKLKDFLFAKKKMTLIKNMVFKFQEIFGKFKNQKEVEGTMSFAESSIELAKKLSKVAIIAIPAKIGAKAIEKIFLGGKKTGGLLAVFKKIASNKKTIETGKKTVKDIFKATGTMFLTSIILTGIAVASIPAMIGALAMKGIVWLMIGTFELLNKSKKSVAKGSLVLLVMSASIITFALGLGLMVKAVKGMKLKDVGLMIASIAGIGLAVAGIGLLAVPISIGSASLLLLGASLGILALTLNYWKTLDTKKSMSNIKEAIGGLREVFGLEFGKNTSNKSFGQRLIGGIGDIAIGILNMGSSFFIMGQILLTGFALGMLYHGLKNWSKFNAKKSIENVKLAINGLNEAFGLNDTRKKSLFGKLGSLVGGALDMASTLFKAGGTLIKTGTIMLAMGMMDVIKLELKPWENYASKKPIGNVKEAITGLTDAFGLNGSKKTSFFGKLGDLIGGSLDMATVLLQAGGTLVRMGTIMLAMGMADVIKQELKPWENYDASNPIGNVSTAVTGLTDLFGLNGIHDNNPLGPIGSLASSIFDMATTFLQAGGTLVRMGTILLATGMLDKIREHLIPWENYTASDKAISNVKNTIDKMLDVFGLGGKQEEGQGNGSKIANAVKKFWNGAVDIGKSIFNGAKNIAKLIDIGPQMKSIVAVTTAAASVYETLTNWEKYNLDTDNIVEKIGTTIGKLAGIAGSMKKIKDADKSGIFERSLYHYFKDATGYIKKGVLNIIDACSGWKDSQLGDVTGITTNIETAVGSLASIGLKMQEVVKSDNSGALERTVYHYFRDAAENTSEGIEFLVKGLNDAANIKPNGLESLFSIVKGVNFIDFKKVSAVTELFTSFKSIGVKPIDKFTAAVEKFSDSCKELVESLNNFEPISNNVISNENGETTISSGSVGINNSQDLANAIAEAIKSLPINVHTDISDVRLVVNGESGRKVVLTLDN